MAEWAVCLLPMLAWNVHACGCTCVYLPSGVTHVRDLLEDWLACKVGEYPGLLAAPAQCYDTGTLGLSKCLALAPMVWGKWLGRPADMPTALALRFVPAACVRNDLGRNISATNLNT